MPTNLNNEQVELVSHCCKKELILNQDHYDCGHCHQPCEMYAINHTKRHAQQTRSKALGRCVCSMPSAPIPCPCPWFESKVECHCAGEKISGTHAEWLMFNLKK